MGFFTALVEIINNLIPNKNQSFVSKLNDLTAQYQAALDSGQTTLAAQLRVQMIELRKEMGLPDE